LIQLQHPSSLNAFQRYRQACVILKKTSRASNPAWYQEALDLDLQLHIRTDAVSFSCFLHDRKKNQWSAGPAMREEILRDPSLSENFAREILKLARSHGGRSLGVILHVADEFATSELKPELDNPAALNDLRYAAIRDPASILEDATVSADQASWRVLPYPAAGAETIGTAITITRQYAPFLQSLRDTAAKENFPLITHALSAPLVVMAGLADSVKPTPGKPFIAILQYPSFTVMAFFNEHSDLRLVRTLQHRGIRRAGNFRNTLHTTNASLEFINPDLFVLPLGKEVDTQLVADLETSMPESRVELVDLPSIDGQPSWCPEPWVTSQPPKTGADAGLSHTFTILKDDKWALQDFLPVPLDVIELYPDQTEMRVLRLLRVARVAVVFLSLGAVAYMVFGLVDVIRQPQWAFQPQEAEVVKGRLAMLNKEMQTAEHWGNLLEDRSKAWISMEALARLFPEGSGVQVKAYNHSIKPDNSPGKSKVGFVKEWRITGLARDEALEYLSNLNTREGISAYFEDIARITGNEAYQTTADTRSIVVNVRTQENSAFKRLSAEEFAAGGEDTYPFTFDLTISQRFEAQDPLAVNVAKAP
jgi:hypothetical protein